MWLVYKIESVSIGVVTGLECKLNVQAHRIVWRTAFYYEALHKAAEIGPYAYIVESPETPEFVDVHVP